VGRCAGSTLLQVFGALLVDQRGNGSGQGGVFPQIGVVADQCGRLGSRVGDQLGVAQQRQQTQV